MKLVSACGKYSPWKQQGMESWLYLGDAQREEFQAFECGCKWQASKNVHVSCLATQGSKEDRRISKNQTPKISLIQRSRKMSWVHVFTVSQVQLFKKCVCFYFLFSRGVDVVMLPGAVMLCAIQVVVRQCLICIVELTNELWHWSCFSWETEVETDGGQEKLREIERSFVCVCFIFFPLKEHLWFRSRGEWGGNSYHLHLWKRK